MNVPLSNALGADADDNADGIATHVTSAAT
jgi:hypothetical protein